MPLELLKKMFGSLLPRSGPSDVVMVEIEDRSDVSTISILGVLRAKFRVEVSETDIALSRLCPPPVATTVRRFHFEAEGDEATEGYSVRDMRKSGASAMSLRERLLFELKYFEKFGVHPNSNGSGTLCPTPTNGTGMRVYWASECLWIRWCTSTCRDMMFRARLAIPAPCGK